METIYDWVTVLIFAGLVTRFISQSVKEEDGSDDSVWHYMPPSIGCAIANWLGNNGWDVPAILLIVLTCWYIYRVLLTPRNNRPPS